MAVLVAVLGFLRFRVRFHVHRHSLDHYHQLHLHILIAHTGEGGIWREGQSIRIAMCKGGGGGPEEGAGEEGEGGKRG